MKTFLTSKFTRRCLILVVMTLALVFVASSGQNTQAVSALPCCELCYGDGDPELIDEYCGAVCYNEPNYLTCVSTCEGTAMACYNNCTYCGGGGPPGGQCNSSTDCNWNQFCGADNMCHTF